MEDVLEPQEKQITGRRKTEGGKIGLTRRAQSVEKACGADTKDKIT